MPNWYFYSTEALPNPDLIGKSGYTPDNETVKHGGFVIPMLPAKEWYVAPSSMTTVRHRDWLDKRGTTERIYIEDLVPALRAKYEERGVVILDHEPTDAEKAKIAKQSENRFLAWLMTQVEWYENQVREKEVTGQGRTKPTPYEDYAYTILGLTKPYSVEAMRAQRHPGEAVGEQIVAALERLDKRRTEESHRAAEESQRAKQREPVAAR